MTRILLALFVLAALSAVAACGPGPPEPPVTGAIGASSIEELIDRYREAHQTEHLAEVRAIYLQQGFGEGPFNRGTRMVGGAEAWMPEIFKLELVDVKAVEVEPMSTGSILLSYAYERPAVQANGFIPVGIDEIVFKDSTTKLLLLVRRRGVSNAPVRPAKVGQRRCRPAKVSGQRRCRPAKVSGKAPG